MARRTSTGAIASSGDAQLKEEVARYWNSRPCDSRFTARPPGTPAFFAEIEQYRYATHPFMHEVCEFGAFAGKWVLEVGCGLGTDLLQYARAGARVSAVDLTSVGIDLVRQRFALEDRPVDARVGDAEQLPFEDGLFDLVYSFGVLHHTPDIRRAIDEVHRVLKPGGRATIMLYHRDSFRVWLGAPLHAARLLARGHRLPAALIEDWIRATTATRTRSAGPTRGGRRIACSQAFAATSTVSITRSTPPPPGLSPLSRSGCSHPGAASSSSPRPGSDGRRASGGSVPHH